MPKKYKTILIICFSDLRNDPRVYKQIKWLSDKYHIVAAGLSDPKVDGVSFINISYTTPKKYSVSWLIAVLKKITLLVVYYFDCNKYYYSNEKYMNAWLKLKNLRPDLIVANELETLPIANWYRETYGSKIIFDAHEYYTKQYEHNFLWNLLFKHYTVELLKKNATQVDKMVTVCEGLAQEYMREFGIKNISIITNSPEYKKLFPSNNDFSRIKLIHHGAAIPARKIENMIKATFYLKKNFHLYLMLVPGDQEYINSLKELAGKSPNIHFLEPVKMVEIPKYINKFDIGLFLLEPTNFNYTFALPNKFFEYIQARLAIAIGPSPEMARIVKKHDLGVVADDFTPQAMAEKLNSLSLKDIMYYKNQSHKISKELSGESNKQALLKIVRENLH